MGLVRPAVSNSKQWGNVLGGTSRFWSSSRFSLFIVGFFWGILLLMVGAGGCWWIWSLKTSAADLRSAIFIPVVIFEPMNSRLDEGWYCQVKLGQPNLAELKEKRRTAGDKQSCCQYFLSLFLLGSSGFHCDPVSNTSASAFPYQLSVGHLPCNRNACHDAVVCCSCIKLIYCKTALLLVFTWTQLLWERVERRTGA